MSIPLVVNGVTFDYPEVDDNDWGPEATDWAAAVTNGVLQKAGGLFQLLAEVDFGTAFGIKALYFKTRTANNASAGQYRLARADVISWRNQANDGNLDLGVNSSNLLTFNGTSIQNTLSVTDTATIDLTLSADVLSADIKALSIDNSMISASAAIAFSKFAALASGNILVGSAGNVATSVAMSGDVTIVAAGTTTIGANKVLNSMLAQMAQSTFKGRVASSGTGDPVDLTATQATAILNNFVGDSGSGGTKGLVLAPAAGDAAANKFLKADGTWTTPVGAGDVMGPASASDNAMVRFNGTTGKLLQNSLIIVDDSGNLNGINDLGVADDALIGGDLAVTGDTTLNAALTGVLYATSGVVGTHEIVNADVAAAAAIAYSKLAALTASRALQSSAGGVIEVSAVTSTELGYVSGVTSAIQTQLGTKLGNVLTTTGDIIYSSSGTTAARLGIGATGQSLKVVGGIPAWASDTPPLLTKYTSGSGTHTFTGTPLWVRIRIVGAGAGGSGSAVSGGNNGAAGGNTTIASTLLVGTGGGAGNNGASPSVGGVPTSTNGGAILITGGGGSGYPPIVGTATGFNGPAGGNSAFGGGGGGGSQVSSSGGGTAGLGKPGGTNSGGGGGAGGMAATANAQGGAGGGAGGYGELLLTGSALSALSGSVTYAVGAGGAGGAAGSPGSTGGDGAAGIILIEEGY